MRVTWHPCPLKVRVTAILAMVLILALRMDALGSIPGGVIILFSMWFVVRHFSFNRVRQR